MKKVLNQWQNNVQQCIKSLEGYPIDRIESPISNKKMVSLTDSVRLLKGGYGSEVLKHIPESAWSDPIMGACWFEALVQTSSIEALLELVNQNKHQAWVQYYERHEGSVSQYVGEQMEPWQWNVKEKKIGLLQPLLRLINSGGTYPSHVREVDIKGTGTLTPQRRWYINWYAQVDQLIEKIVQPLGYCYLKITHYQEYEQLSIQYKLDVEQGQLLEHMMQSDPMFWRRKDCSGNSMLTLGLISEAPHYFVQYWLNSPREERIIGVQNNANGLSAFFAAVGMRRGHYLSALLNHSEILWQHLGNQWDRQLMFSMIRHPHAFTLLWNDLRAHQQQSAWAQAVLDQYEANKSMVGQIPLLQWALENVSHMTESSLLFDYEQTISGHNSNELQWCKKQALELPKTTIEQYYDGIEGLLCVLIDQQCKDDMCHAVRQNIDLQKHIEKGFEQTLSVCMQHLLHPKEAYEEFWQMMLRVYEYACEKYVQNWSLVGNIEPKEVREHLNQILQEHIQKSLSKSDVDAQHRARIERYYLMQKMQHQSDKQVKKRIGL